MDSLDTREWLLTNGLGGFASGTVCDAHTRTYHGWLIAALEPPVQRTLLLSRIDATLEISGQGFELGTNVWVSGTIAPLGYKLLQSFQTHPIPRWVWGHYDWQFSREILLPYGLSPSIEDKPPSFCNRVLIRYRYEGQDPALLKLRPIIGDRNFHAQQHTDPDLRFSQVIEPQRIHLQAMRSNWVGTLWQLAWTQGQYHPDAVWYWSYRYLEETQRGLRDQEDLFSPGYLTILLQPGESVTLEGRVDPPGTTYYPLPDRHSFDQALQLEQQRLSDRITPALEQFGLKEASHQSEQALILQQLLQAGEQFITYRASIAGPTVIAGYHWFNDWGRDTLIALPGLALTTHQFSLAKGLLETFGTYCQDGLIPNTFPDASSRPTYNSLDAALWWIETLGLYLEATQDWDFLRDQYPIVQRIYKAFMAGTSYHIRIDAFDGLVTWEFPGVALTWMDAVVDGQPVTPRQGKPIEINALWYSALCWANQWAERLQKNANGDETTKFVNQARRYAQQAEQVKASLQKFWNAEYGYFYDRIEPNDRPDGSIRPNAVIALSLYHCGFSAQQAQQALQVARDRLLTPYGLRSLDPFHPSYLGRYAGNPRYRDCAYHQGTVWSWLIGPFIRAWQRFYPTEPLPWSGDRLFEHLQHQAGLGSISEIFDGDAPHAPQGAIAQAWSVAELIRHWNDLNQA
ncbi:MAG: amylo-alpha-1,6-glucosidase [Oculatellaceae cyanobacterium bins.114]|nr:amylo-alpha-1,6-glucosidase [Oculatellaceae cyanobacterium bins.114]